ncbi:hypothetical protein ACQZV8_03595 [Magnetococcales bacterium HHB-1]
MSHRVNIIFEDPVWTLLEQIPRGSRSQEVNEALRHWFGRKRRQQVANDMDDLRSKITSVPSKDLVAVVREDRDR